MAIGPIVPVVMPSDLAGASNGNLPDSLLTAVHPRGKLHHLAARCWVALVAAAKAEANIDLTFDYGGMYRPYADQVLLFQQRYTSSYNVGVNSTNNQRTWNGQTYYIRIGVAAAATPGTSNHGWGLAIDSAIGTDPSNAQGIDPAMGWLIPNAGRFGFAWEMTSESWHIRMVTGDSIPADVLAFEAGNNPLPPVEVQPQLPSEEDDEMTTATLWRDSRFANAFLVNGDVCTVDDLTYASLSARGVPVVVNKHNQMLIGCMRKAQMKMAQMAPVGGQVQDFTPPADLA